MLIPLTVLSLAFPVASAARQDGETLFRERIAPILETRCLRCHDAKARKGKLSFEDTERPAGVIVPGDPDSSLLVERISGEQPEMPKDSPPLAKEEVEALREWIEAGAPWSEGVIGARRWWSLRPLESRAPPEVPAEWRAWIRQPLDAFVLDGLLARGLEPSEEADRRTLLRRLHFDLVGLPPEPEHVEAFLADTSPDAYEREVERLLASPRYGERWARHWLDVVHYADTHGYDKDKPRWNAWPYRDYVIRALNEDRPWARFVTEQIAGDTLAGSAIDGGAVVATGMLAAGPWDFVGHVELREGTVDKKKTRNLDRDDVVTNVMSSFQSLTVHCARCHDHKFDPIEQADYYDLQAVFAGVERADREYDRDPQVAAERAALRAERDALQRSLASGEESLDRLIATDERESVSELRALRERLMATVPAPDRDTALGYHSQVEPTAEVEKWVQLDLGSPRAIERVVVHPCDEVFGQHPGPGFGLPAALELRIEVEGEWREVAVWHAKDAGARHGNRPIELELAGTPTARFVRIHAPVLWERTDDYCFALAELEVGSGGENVALAATVSATDSIEAGERWGMRFLVDGKSPWHPDLARLEEVEGAWIEARAALESPAARSARETDAARLQEVEGALAQLPPSERVYAVATSFAPEGAFTPPPEGAPRPIHRLERGDVKQPREPSTPGALGVLDHAPSTFPHEEEGARRAALAAWIAHPENPLTWRSVVNRVWQFHFGRGLVATPNDFGRMGELPSHPELLDFLAVRFRDQGGALKDLHRELVTSATYRQSSAHRPQAAAIDDGNRLLWRANRRRLEAEALRDSILAVSGNLDLDGGGPGFRLFAFEDDHSPRYLYEAADLEDPDTFKRSVYRFVVRSVPDPWMTAFDCADPSSCTPARSETTTPLQALSLLNDRFLLRQAERFAARLRAEADTDDVIARAVALAWQRSPTPREHFLLEEHAASFGLEAACRVLFNSNELLYVD